ncbi:hypothetical protein COT40_00825 [Candidatus Peregrinibacteria bacterium CG08_land_8_20_14_0_20_41_10]|nr:MAG: hypothetical protein COT40_00825 [Candidatus Peregrinibacteria bacterium CG08_land_8_20_14_0_20_41_10]
MLALATNSLENYGLNRVFEFAKKAGFEAIDLEITKVLDTQDASYLNSLISQYQLPIVAVQAPSSPTKKNTLETIALAEEIKAEMVILFPPRLLDYQYTQWLKKNLTELRRKHRVRILMINSPANNILGFIPSRSMNTIVDLKHFREICLDTSNLVSKKLSLIHTYELLEKQILHIQLSNVSRGRFHFFPQEGTLPLESFLTKLKQNKYRHHISLKVKTKYLTFSDSERVLELLKQARGFMEKYFR